MPYRYTTKPDTISICTYTKPNTQSVWASNSYRSEAAEVMMRSKKPPHQWRDAQREVKLNIFVKPPQQTGTVEMVGHRKVRDVIRNIKPLGRFTGGSQQLVNWCCTQTHTYIQCFLSLHNPDYLR